MHQRDDDDDDSNHDDDDDDNDNNDNDDNFDDNYYDNYGDHDDWPINNGLSTIMTECISQMVTIHHHFPCRSIIQGNDDHDFDYHHTKLINLGL